MKKDPMVTLPKSVVGELVSAAEDRERDMLEELAGGYVDKPYLKDYKASIKSLTKAIDLANKEAFGEA